MAYNINKLCKRYKVLSIWPEIQIIVMFGQMESVLA